MIAAVLAATSGAYAQVADREVAVAAPASGQQTGSDLAALVARFDDEWTRRDRPEALAAARTALDQATKLAPNSYDVLWREARYLAWISDDTSLPTEERSELGKKGWDYAEQALKLEPGRVEGHYYAAINMGNYSLGIGILKALTQGIEGKFKERLSRAEQIDPTFDNGTIQAAWGRFWYELPWPKYSARRSEEALRNALRVNAASARARVYLADLLVKEGKSAQARKVLEDVISIDARYDVPEVRRMQQRARDNLQKLR